MTTAGPINVRCASGFVDNTNYYRGTVGTVQGVEEGFTACVLARMRRGNGPGTRFIFGTWSRFNTGVGGWGIGCDDARWKMFVTQASDGEKLENFGGAAYATNNMTLGSLVLLHFVWDGTSARLYVQGQTDVTPITPTDGLLLAPTLAPTFGVEGSAARAYAFDGGILGAAYGTVAFTADQVADHTLACMNVNSVVQDAGDSFTSRWSFSGQSTAPASLSDIEGAVTLTRTGALSLSAFTPNWISG